MNVANTSPEACLVLSRREVVRGSTCVARNAAPSFYEVALAPVPPPLLCLIAKVAASGVSLFSSWKKVVNVAALALCPIPLRWESVGLEAGPGVFQTRLRTAASLREELAVSLSVFGSSPACTHRHR